MGNTTNAINLFPAPLFDNTRSFVKRPSFVYHSKAELAVSVAGIHLLKAVTL